MYEQYFDLTGRPFGSAPDAGCWFPAEAIEQTRVALTQCIELAGGVGLLVGPPGTGKSLLFARLAADFGAAFQVVTLASARLCSRRALLQNILFELGLPYRGVAEGELRLDLIDHLRTVREGSCGMLLLVDEAHGLPLKLLDELRMLTNLVRDGNPCIQLVLGGSASLEDKLADPRMRSLNQRISTRSYLESMVYGESCDYVRFQLSRVGGAGDLFSEGALSAVYHASDGTPRVINQLCSHVLVSIAQQNEHHVTEVAVERAWADLQQLPAPWNEQTASGHAGLGEQAVSETGVIEFGPLSDEMPSSQPLTVSPEVLAEADLPDLLDEAVGSDTGTQDPQQGAGYSSAAERGTEDPFAEEFEEEYVVLDRYLTIPADISQSGFEQAASPAVPVVEAPGSAADCTGTRRMETSLAGDQNVMPLTITADETDVVGSGDSQLCQTEAPDEIRKRQEVASLIEDMGTHLAGVLSDVYASEESWPASLQATVARESQEQTSAPCDDAEQRQAIDRAPPSSGVTSALSGVGSTEAYLVLHSLPATESVPLPDLQTPGLERTREPAPDGMGVGPDAPQQAAFRDLLKPFFSNARGRAAS